MIKSRSSRFEQSGRYEHRKFMVGVLIRSKTNQLRYHRMYKKDVTHFRQTSRIIICAYKRRKLQLLNVLRRNVLHYQERLPVKCSFSDFRFRRKRHRLFNFKWNTPQILENHHSSYFTDFRNVALFQCKSVTIDLFIFIWFNFIKLSGVPRYNLTQFSVLQR